MSFCNWEITAAMISDYLILISQLLNCLERFAHNDFGFANEKLRRALLRTADDRDQAIDLAARDQTQHAAGWAREHGPVGIFFFADLRRRFPEQRRFRAASVPGIHSLRMSSSPTMHSSCEI